MELKITGEKATDYAEELRILADSVIDSKVAEQLRNTANYIDNQSITLSNFMSYYVRLISENTKLANVILLYEKKFDEHHIKYKRINIKTLNDMRELGEWNERQLKFTHSFFEDGGGA